MVCRLTLTALALTAILMMSTGKAEGVLFGAYLPLDCGRIGAWIVTDCILDFVSGVEDNLVSRLTGQVRSTSHFSGNRVNQELTVLVNGNNEENLNLRLRAAKALSIAIRSIQAPTIEKSLGLLKKQQS